MNFQDALVQLKGRIPMHRTGWEPQDGYVVLMPGMSHVWKIVLQPAPNAGNYIFSFEDFCSEDWEVFSGLPDKPALEAEVDSIAA
jgi:hypothetical protein